MQLYWLLAVWKLPPAQAAHVRSLDDVRLAVMYVPAAHTVAAAQAYWLVAVENVSAAQAAHVRSLLAVRLARL